MFSRKYVFETKTTRLRRIIISSAFLFLFSLVLIITFLTYIPIYAKLEKGKASGAFFQKSPDAIAVFTGDKGRINYAMKLLKNHPTAKLFISGVYATNSFETILSKQNDPQLNLELNAVDSQIDLDYESKNTLENVRETVEFLQKNPGLTRVLIISSDYHIMRIRLIISHFMKKSKMEFFFDSVPTNYSTWKQIKKLILESVKLARTFFILKILRQEIISD